MVIRREYKMANYYASIRTNYFRVKDEEEFRKFMAHQLKHLKERFSGKRAFSLSSSEEPDEQ